MKKILIAIDYDPTAKKVAEMGFLLAKTMKAEVTLLHVMADSIYYSTLQYSSVMGFGGFTNADFDDISHNEGLEKAAQHFLDGIKKQFGDASTETEIEVGSPAETILSTAKKLHTDVIVIGSHSRRWLEKIVMGSVTQDVVNDSLIPIFIVPTKEKESKI